MRHVPLALLLGSLLALAPAVPARATGLEADPDSVFGLSVRVFEEIFDDDVELDDQERFVGAFAYAALALGGGQIDLSLEGDPDPSIDYTLEISNLSNQTVFVTFLMLMPMVPIGPGSQAQASLDVTVSDGDGGGLAFLGTLNPSIQLAFVSEDGIAATPLGVDVGPGTAAPGAFYSVGPVAGPAPDPMLGPAFILLGINGGFSLSAGDSAVLVGNVTLVPEPGALLLLPTGAVGLAARAMRRRTWV